MTDLIWIVFAIGGFVFCHFGRRYYRAAKALLEESGLYLEVACAVLQEAQQARRDTGALLEEWTS